MSRLTDLIAATKTKDPVLGQELEREFQVLSSRRSFGLNFERHRPETVELPGRPVRTGNKVRVLPPRGTITKGDQRLWKVLGFEAASGTRMARVELVNSTRPEHQTIPVEDLVIVAEFRDYIYPGLVSTGKVASDAVKPFHTLINGENYHALKLLTFTHRGKVDVIYIDPPYNTGARDWKYSNDFVDRDDIYRHSKWLAFMERRLIVARELLNPENSVLIVTIDEKEYLRLGLLLEQTFPGQRIQMVSTSINPSGVARGKEFYRVDEYIYFVFFGHSVVQDTKIPGLCITKSDIEQTEDNYYLGIGKSKEEQPPPVRWESLLRSGTGARRQQSHLKFYPVLVDINAVKIVDAGDPLPLDKHPDDYTPPEGLVAVWPIRQDGSEGRWQLNRTALRTLLADGHVKIGSIKRDSEKVTVLYLPTGLRSKLSSGELLVVGEDKHGGLDLKFSSNDVISGRPKTQWTTKAHSATDHGSSLLRKIIPGRKFPYPKSPFRIGFSTGQPA